MLRAQLLSLARSEMVHERISRWPLGCYSAFCTPLLCLLLPDVSACILSECSGLSGSVTFVDTGAAGPCALQGGCICFYQVGCMPHVSQGLGFLPISLGQGACTRVGLLGVGLFASGGHIACLAQYSFYP